MVGYALLLVAAGAALGEQPVILAMVQQWAPERRGAVVGLVLGTQFILSGVATVLIGFLADNIGLSEAFRYVAIAPLIGLPFLKYLPVGKFQSGSTIPI